MTQPTYYLHPKQLRALFSKATEILYGGAAGGGKSYLLRVAAITYAMYCPGVQVALFRRNYQDLLDNHFKGHRSFYDLLGPYLKSGQVTINDQKREIRFWNGSIISYRHADTEKDLFKTTQGAQFHILLIDEGTQFTDAMYTWLRGRVRLGGFKPPKDFELPLPKIIIGANPGGVGHQAFKMRFVDPKEPFKVWRAPKDDGAMIRQFIPALLEDNPTMTDTDPDYEDKLMGLSSPEQARAMRYGDWDVVAGAAFEKLARKTHMIRPFKPPVHWTKFMAIDWGTAKPFSVGWYCVVEGETWLKGDTAFDDVYLPDKAIVRYRELYGWNGKPDKGCRKESYEVADEILAIEDEANEVMDYRIGDAAMWAQVDGPSVSERFFTHSKGRINLRQSDKDRLMGYQEVRARIAGHDKRPMIYVTANCVQWWRTTPALMLDETNPEKGPDTKQEDHCYDESAYACMSRPFVTSEAQRHLREFWRLRRENKLDGTDPYRLKRKA